MQKHRVYRDHVLSERKFKLKTHLVARNVVNEVVVGVVAILAMLHAPCVHACVINEVVVIAVVVMLACSENEVGVVWQFWSCLHIRAKIISLSTIMLRINRSN